MTLSSGIRAIALDVIEEAARIAHEAERRALPLRLIGGTAIQLRSRHRLPAALHRSPKDIDVLIARGVQPEVSELLVESSYVPDEDFNRLEGSRRLLFLDEQHGRQLDVFVHTFEMCHTLPLADRLLIEPATLPLSDLALTKLQIVELNPKDRLDLYALLCAHEVADHDGDAINGARIAQLCGGDWGLWRTCTINLARLRDGLPESGLDSPDRERVARGVETLEEMIAVAPKTRRWRMRSRLGDRVRWYETPDEIRED